MAVPFASFAVCSADGSLTAAVPPPRRFDKVFRRIRSAKCAWELTAAQQSTDGRASFFGWIEDMSRQTSAASSLLALGGGPSVASGAGAGAGAGADGGRTSVEYINNDTDMVGVASGKAAKHAAATASALHGGGVASNGAGVAASVAPSR